MAALSFVWAEAITTIAPAQTQHVSDLESHNAAAV
jgi:hypothetical protein